MSIFAGPDGNGLRHQYSELSADQINGTIGVAADSIANAKLLHKFNHGGQMAFLRSSLRSNANYNAADPATVAIMIVAPGKDPTDDDNKLLFVKIESGEIINYEMGAVAGLKFDPGTRLYAYIPADSEVAAAAVAAGYVKMTTWG